MLKQKITIVKKVDKKKWSDFVFNHPHGNIFQTPEMFNVYKNTKNYEPVLVASIDENKNILGVLLAVIQKEYSGLLGNFTARAVIFGGPLIKDDNAYVLDSILKNYNSIVKRKAIYSQFRNMWDWCDQKEIFINNGIKYEEHLNILIDLNKGIEELWKDIHSKRRNEIRRAKKEGTTFSVKKNSIKILHECYTILKDVYKRAKLPIPDFSFFANILENTQNNIGLKIFCAENDNKLIGCLIALVYKNTIYNFYAGSYSDYYNKYPNDLIPWEIFLWGKNNKYSVFDFGGAGKPNKPYGVRNYKKKFGGEFVNYGRFQIIHKPILMIIGKTGLKLWKKIK